MTAFRSVASVTLAATDVARFFSKVRIAGPNECWLWAGATGGTQGYGEINIDGVNLRAHRVAYEFMVGVIPPDLTLDHLCRNRACVNPAHLEPVTRAENVLRGYSGPARNKRKTHCAYGHELAEDNVYRNARGHRYCRICMRRREANRRPRTKVGQ